MNISTFSTYKLRDLTSARLRVAWCQIYQGHINDEGDNQCPKHSEEAARWNSGWWKSRGEQTYVTALGKSLDIKTDRR